MPQVLRVRYRAGISYAYEVRLKPETESRLQELAAQTGRAPDELVEDATVGYLEELAHTRQMLDGRYDDV
jgi:predicted DNA-binding protein